MKTNFRLGDSVIYTKQKYSVRPGPHAKRIYPTPFGDYYFYQVDKFWTVISVRTDRQIVVRTRRGKEHTLNAADPALRRATWWERLLFRRRFPALQTSSQDA